MVARRLSSSLLLALLLALGLPAFSWQLDFESPVNVAPAGDPGAREATHLTQVTSDEAHGGTGALRLTYDHSQYVYGMAYLHVEPDSGGNTLSLWVKGDGSGCIVTLRLSEADWDAWETPPLVLDYTGWRRFSFNRWQCVYNAWGNGIPEWDLIRIVAFMPRRASVDALVDDLEFYTDPEVLPDDEQGALVPININLNQSQGDFPRLTYGFSQGGESNDPDYLRPVVDALAHTMPELIRIDHIYDYFDVWQGPGQYDFSKLDRMLRCVLETGAQPLICLGYMPKGLSQNGTIDSMPSDLEEWGRLVEATVRHYKDEGYLFRYWELWNEPNGAMLGHNVAPYLDLYRITAQAVKRADPYAYIGGPGLAGHSEHWIIELVEFCKREELPLDFISYHDYKLTPRSYAAVASNLSYLLAVLLGHDNQVQLVMDEWNADAGLNPTRNDGNYDAAYLAASLYYMDSSPLDVQCFFEPKDGWNPDAEWWGRWGLFTSANNPKAAYFAWRLVADLARERVAASFPIGPVGCIATCQASGLRALVWNCAYTEEGPSRRAVVRTKGLPEGERLRLQLWRVDATHSNPAAGTPSELALVRDELVSRAEARKVELDLPPGSLVLIALDSEHPPVP